MNLRDNFAALLFLVAILPACRGTQANLNADTADCTNMFPTETWTDLLAKGAQAGRFLVELHEPSTPEKPPGGWVWDNGRLAARGGATYRSLITRCPVGNFEIEFDWLVTPGGNSGIKYLVSTLPGPMFAKGLEYQIIDDTLHPDARAGENRQTGALYDLIPPKNPKTLYPPGEKNHGRIFFKDGKGEHWLNGDKILEFYTASPEFQSRISQSKFKKIPNFAKGKRGHVLLQHHGDAVQFTLLRIRSNLVDDEIIRDAEGRSPGTTGR